VTHAGLLADIRILAIEQYGAGPFASLQLSDLGADVIKIEDTNTGDVGRSVEPFRSDNSSLFFETFNRGKRSISLDLSCPAGREVFEDLVRCSDAVLNNLRGDVPARLGVTYDQLSHINERIVCVSLSGWGSHGELAKEPSYDYILQAATGWMSLTGEPDGPPTRSGLSLVDFASGYAAALSLLAGVHAARRTGRGRDFDLSLYDTAMSLLTYAATWTATEGYEVERTPRSAHPTIVPFQLFRTADDWIVIGCAKDKFWKRLMIELELSGYINDPRFATFAARRENATELVALIEERLRRASTHAWLGLLRSAGVPAGPVRTVREALQDSWTAARDLIIEYEHPELGTVRTVRSAVDRLEAGQRKRAPLPNEHLEELLMDNLGYSPQRRADLAARGAFGNA
jgi:crotonobetainyl-CoA:carnitine CoA-transferase CaiB-like acyl-CoA transferase